jgi:hypothetical protein
VFSKIRQKCGGPVLGVLSKMIQKGGGPVLGVLSQMIQKGGGPVLGVLSKHVVFLVDVGLVVLVAQVTQQKGRRHMVSYGEALGTPWYPFSNPQPVSL